MKRTLSIVLALGLVGGLSACEDKEVRREIHNEIYQWQLRTWHAVCDVATVLANKDANGNPDLPGTYGPPTVDYCGPGNGGEPHSPPPEWGN